MIENQLKTKNTERPRERLESLGPSALTDEELLQLILGAGTKARPIKRLAEEVLSVMDHRNGSLATKDLLKIPGIGLAKAGSLVAALEFSRRRIRPEGIKIKAASDVLPLIQHYASKKQEHFLCISLNGAHEVINTRCITIGLLNSSQVHPREVFTDPISDRAAAIIIAHNHPSGNLEASEADLSVTRLLIDSGKILGIKVLDHIILGARGSYMSLRETGLISFG